MASNKNYWAERSERRLLDALGGAAGLERELAAAYRTAAEGINDDIAKLYGRYAQDNALSYTKAMRYINGPEYRKWRMSLQEYVDLVELTGSDRLKLEVDTLAMRTRITRLDVLMTQVKMKLVELAKAENKGLWAQLTGAYKKSYYRGIFDYQKKLGYLTEFSTLEAGTIKDVLRTPWIGTDFSTRIWTRTDKLTDLIRQEITTAAIQGKDYRSLAKSVAKQMDTSYAAAKRLVQTETAFVVGQGELRSYEETGIDDYEYLSTLDTRTSSICQDLDGQIFPVKDAVAGLNFPPMHAYCRSTTVPSLGPDWDDPDATRIARDANGKNITVPADVKYEDWYQKHVVGPLGPDGAEALVKKVKNESADLKQFEKYKGVLGKDAPGTFGDFQNLKYNKSVKWQQLKGDYRKMNAYNKIAANEPPITADMKDTAIKSETNMAGLENRLKSKESFLRKIKTDSDGAIDLKAIDDTISSTNDVIRYTFEADADSLVEKYGQINNVLSEKDYTLVKVKNFWIDKRNPYNGINCIYKSSSGQGFEIQYHTPEGFELKNGRVHQLYEEMRLDGADPKRRMELMTEMQVLFSKLKRPKGIESIGR